MLPGDSVSNSARWAESGNDCDVDLVQHLLQQLSPLCNYRHQGEGAALGFHLQGHSVDTCINLRLRVKPVIGGNPHLAGREQSTGAQGTRFALSLVDATVLELGLDRRWASGRAVACCISKLATRVPAPPHASTYRQWQGLLLHPVEEVVPVQLFGGTAKLAALPRGALPIGQDCMAKPGVIDNVGNVSHETGEARVTEDAQNISFLGPFL